MSKLKLHLVSFNPDIKTVKRRYVPRLNEKFEIMKDYIGEIPSKPLSKKRRIELEDKLWPR